MLRHICLNVLRTHFLQSYGVWYINALSPGVQPHDEQMVQLIQDLINCVEKKLVRSLFKRFIVM